MSNVIIAYPIWAPQRFPVDPLPHTFSGMDAMTQAHHLLAAYEFMGFNRIVVNPYPDVPGEMERTRQLLDMVADTSMKLCVMDPGLAVEGWQTPESLAARWRQFRTVLDWENHPGYDRTADGRPELYIWRTMHRYHEYTVRQAKWMYAPDGSPQAIPHIRARYRTNCLTDHDGVPLDEKLKLTPDGLRWALDTRWGYPGRKHFDDGALPFCVTYNTASRDHKKNVVLLPPNLDAFKLGLSQPVPAGADRIMRDYELTEMGNLLIRGQEWAYMTAVRKALVGA